MPGPRHRRPVLSPQAIQGLQQAKQQILAAVMGRLPDRLVLATAEAAGRLARGEQVPAKLMSGDALELARDILQGLARGNWKPETALKLQKGSRELGGLSTQRKGGHELSQ